MMGREHNAVVCAAEQCHIVINIIGYFLLTTGIYYSIKQSVKTVFMFDSHCELQR